MMRKGRKEVKRKALAIASASVMAATMMMGAVPTMAAGTNYGTNIGGTKVTNFDKYLVMDQEANVPNATFSYAITAGTAVKYDVAGKKVQILAGVDADKVTMKGVGTTEANKIAFSTSDKDSAKTDVNAMVKDYDNTKQKYVKKTAELDFSNVKFTEPGIYRYIITESGDNQGITNDANLIRVVDVYVHDASDASGKKLTVAGYVLHAKADDVASGDDQGSKGDDPEGKSQGYTNTYDTSDLTFRKEVSGNQASRDKYFEFTVRITGAVAGTIYDVDITEADATSGDNTATTDENKGKANVTKLTVGADGTVEQKFYLQHGQQIKIKGLAKDTKYTVTENEEDYKSTASGVNGYKDATAGNVESKDLNTSYLNTKEGIIPTGVIMTVAPFAAVTLLGGVGAVTLKMKKRREDEE